MVLVIGRTALPQEEAEIEPDPTFGGQVVPEAAEGKGQAEAG